MRKANYKQWNLWRKSFLVLGRRHGRDFVAGILTVLVLLCSVPMGCFAANDPMEARAAVGALSIKPELGLLPDPGSNPDPGTMPDPGSNPDPGTTPDPTPVPNPLPDPQEKTRYIKSVVYDGDYYAQTIVCEGMSFDAIKLPTYMEAAVGWMKDDGYMGVDFVEWNVNWDTRGLEQTILSPGCIVIKGSWVQPLGDGLLGDGTTAAAVTATKKTEYADVYEPVCKINVVEKKGFTLPETIFYYGEPKPPGVIVKMDSRGGFIQIVTDQIYPASAKHAVKIREKGEENWVLVNDRAKAVVNGGLDTGLSIAIMNFKKSGWFLDGKQYEIMVETAMMRDIGTPAQPNEIWETCYSNTVTIDMTPAELLPPVDGGGETENPGEGGGSDDGSSEGTRGGGSRDTQESVTSKELSAKQLETLAKANTNETIVIVDGVKAIFSQSAIEAWAKQGEKVQVRGEVIGERQFRLDIKKGDKSVSHIGEPISLRVPLKKEKGKLLGLSPKQAELQLVAKKDGALVGACYYDAHTGEMVINTEETGTFELVRRKPKEFTDITDHWVKEIGDFASVRGIVSGYSDRTLRPDAAISGTEFDALLAKGLPMGMKKELDTGKQTINRQTAVKIICQVYGVKQSDILHGDKSGNLRLQDPLTRAEALTFVVSAIKQ